MHIYMSPQTILPNMNEIRQAVSEEFRPQDSDDGRTAQSKKLYPLQLRCVGYKYGSSGKCRSQLAIFTSRLTYFP